MPPDALPSPLLIAMPVTAATAERAAAAFGAAAPAHTLTTPQLLAQAAAQRPAAILLCGKHRMDAAAIAALPDSVKLLATHSVGYDHVDVAAAGARGIAVSNTPDVLTDATANVAILLMLMVSRQVPAAQALMADGWRRRLELNQGLGIDLHGRLLGIVGMGRIGRAVAARARALGMRVAYHNRSRLPPALEAGAAYHDSLPSLLAEADVLSLHLPGRAGPPLIDAERLRQLKPGAIFINTARGSLVDEGALLGALDSGHLYGAGLDVFASEPDYDLRLRGRDDVVTLPHIGSATVETRDAMGARALDNVAAVLRGEAPPDRL